MLRSKSIPREMTHAKAHQPLCAKWIHALQIHPSSVGFVVQIRYQVLSSHIGFPLEKLKQSLLIKTLLHSGKKIKKRDNYLKKIHSTNCLISAHVFFFFLKQSSHTKSLSDKATAAAPFSQYENLPEPSAEQNCCRGWCRQNQHPFPC